MSIAMEAPRVAVRDAEAAVATLPAWTYRDAAFFAREREHLFLANWQIVCHASEVAEPGAYGTLNLLGERAFVVRAEDGRLRAFYNVCRHRAAAVVSGTGGTCSGAIRCPYHGWTYGLDGRLKAVPAEASFPGIDKQTLGLRPLDIEVFLGFVFVRFRSGGPSVAERLAPYADELARCRLPEMEPIGAEWSFDRDVDWKTVMDNYLEGYHVPVGHPGLYRLFGSRYEVEVHEGYVSRAVHWLRDARSPNWSEGHYQTLLPTMTHLPEDRQRAWAYYSLLPNLGLEVFADQMDFFHVLPTGPGQCTIRGRSYRLPDPSRRLRAAQYLNARINRQVQVEDDVLIRAVQAGLGSESYVAGILSEKEAGVRQLHDMVRAALPEARVPERPARV